jgi:hypothetical protein
MKEFKVHGTQVGAFLQLACHGLDPSSVQGSSERTRTPTRFAQVVRCLVQFLNRLEREATAARVGESPTMHRGTDVAFRSTRPRWFLSCRTSALPRPGALREKQGSSTSMIRGLESRDGESTASSRTAMRVDERCGTLPASRGYGSSRSRPHGPMCGSVRALAVTSRRRDGMREAGSSIDITLCGARRGTSPNSRR